MKKSVLAALLAAALPFAAIAAPAPKPSAKPIACPSAKVNPNVATLAQLDAVPLVGPARARAIVSGRPYGAVADLRKEIPQAYDQVAQCFAVTTVNVNTATAAAIKATLPGIGDARAAAIVKKRPYATPQDLVAKGALPKAVFDGVKPLVTVN
jgi:DNA uptake protein ComE-like DNA-binding protein